MESTAGHPTANNIPIVAKSMPPAQRLWGKPRERIMTCSTALDANASRSSTLLQAMARQPLSRTGSTASQMLEK